MTNNPQDFPEKVNQQQAWVFGTTDDCDVRLVGSHLSGRVARLSREGDVWTVAPLTGPVTVRGKLVSSVALIRTADDVRIGGIALPWPSSAGAHRCYTVGRSRSCDLRIALPGVSGQHARLIVGFRGTYVLEDMNSTNGIYIDAESRHAVRLIAVNRDTTVYFGSTPIVVGDLIDSIPVKEIESPADAQRRTDVVASQGVESAKDPVLAKDVAIKQDGVHLPKTVDSDTEKAFAYAVNIHPVDVDNVARNKKKLSPSPGNRRTPSRIPQFASGLVTLPLMIVLLLWGQGFWQRTAEKHVDTPPVAAEPLVLPNLPLPHKQERVDRPDASAELLQAANGEDQYPGEELFWVLVEVRQDNTTYRLGTAVAVDTDRLLTTGSIVLAGEKLCEQLGGNLRVCHIRSGMRSDIHQSVVHPALTERLQLASVAKQQFENLGEESEPLTDEQKRESARRLELVNLSFSAASSVDVGWLRVDGRLKGIAIDNSVKLRPRQSVMIYHSGFDNEDPYLDVSASGTTAAVPSRIDEVAPTLQSIQGHGRTPLGPDLAGLNLFGSPVIAGGRLIGIVSYTDSPEAGPGSVMAEFVAPSVMIQALDTTP